jgi:uncharacterized RDD family membrane protein YckC
LRPYSASVLNHQPDAPDAGSMGFAEELPRPASVPPPGWGAATPPPRTTVQATLAADEPAEAAVRWRIAAAFIDNLIVYLAYVALCAALHWRVANLDHLFVLLLAGVAYHFVFEARDGQTPGKRRYGIRVVSLQGGPATPGAVAIRSALRIFDQLPVWYVSGLVSMVRTGPARRQRIGDVAAGTMVVAVDGRAAAKGTPRWMLPAATILATAVSALSVVAVAESGKQPLSSAQQAQFITGCQHAVASQVVDCGCLLNQLQAAGYVTLDSMRTLVIQAQELGGGSGQPRRALIAAVDACRR